METDGCSPRAMLDRAVAQADAITALVSALADHPYCSPSSRALVKASRAEREALRALRGPQEPTVATCEDAMRHLARLDRMLTTAVETGAESCLVLADRLAMMEELDVHQPNGAQLVRRALRLAEQLARLG